MKMFVGEISVNPADDEYCRSYIESFYPSVPITYRCIALPHRRRDVFVLSDS